MESHKNDLLNLRSTEIVQKHRSLFEYAARILTYHDRFKENVTQSGLIPNPPKNYHWFLLTSGAQIELNFISVCRLLSEGHVVESFVLLRTSFELLFYMGYILKDPVGRGKDWEDYDAVYRVQSLKRANRLQPIKLSDHQTDLDAIYKENRSAIDKFTRPGHQSNSNLFQRKYYDNWTRQKSIRDVAVCAEMVDLYDSIYDAFTQYVHPTRKIWNRYAVSSRNGVLIGLGPVLAATDAEVREVIHAGALSLLRLIEMLAENFRIELADDHSRLVEELGRILVESSAE